MSSVVITGGPINGAYCINGASATYTGTKMLHTCYKGVFMVMCLYSLVGILNSPNTQIEAVGKKEQMSVTTKHCCVH